MEAIKSLFSCFPQIIYSSTPASTQAFPVILNEKISREEQQRCKMASQTGQEILDMFFTGPNDHSLPNRIDTVMSHRRKEADAEVSWWKERVANSVISGLVRLVEEVEAKKTQLSGPIVEAYEKSKTKALKFAKEHPVVTGVIVLTAVLIALYLLAPWILEALGFAARGPVARSFAAGWQSWIGDVEYGSLFSYLQRLGTLWGKQVGAVTH